ncbi:MAG: hypothetical protein AAGD14_18245 [Planctomycetota bacterium]
MRSQRCTQCGTRLDVSRMEPGSKFACSNCGAVLVVGDVQVKKTSLSSASPQFERKSGTKGGDAKPTPSRRSRASRGAEPSERSESRKRSGSRERAAPAGGPNKAVIGGGIALVLVIGIVVAMNMGGSGGGGGTDVSGGGGGDAPSAKWWAQTEASIGTMSADQIRAAIQAGRSAGYDANSGFWDPKVDALYKALLKKDKTDQEANRHFGRVPLSSYAGFQEVWAGLEKHQARMPEQYARFYEKYLPAIDGGKEVFLSEEAYAGAEGVLNDFKSWREKMEADPSPVLIDKGLSRAQERAAGFGALPVAQVPVVVFLGSKELHKSMGKDRIEAKKSDFAPRATKVRKRVQAVLKAWDSEVAQPLKLAPLPAETGLFVYCFDDRNAYQAAGQGGRGTALDAGSDLLFFYRPSDPMSFGLIPKTPEEDKWFTSDLGHILVHQLQKKYSKDPNDKYEDAFKTWNGLWLVEGLAEYLGAGAREDGAFTGVSPKASEFLKKIDEGGVPLFEVREIVRFANFQRYASFYRDAWQPELAEDKELPEGVNELINAEAGLFPRKAFQAQCWYLVYFLNKYENGKYKAKFQELVQTMLWGRRKSSKYDPSSMPGTFKSSEDAFATIFGLKTEDDWNKLGDEYFDWIPKAVGSE